MIHIQSTSPTGVAAWLDQLGQVANWRHTKTSPGGASSATFDFLAPPDLQHPCLSAGARLDAYSGSKRVWRGRLEQPQRGLPISCSVTGAAALAKDYLAHATSGDVYHLNTTIDQAITDGLPWTRRTTLLDPAGSGASLSTNIDGLLSTLVSQAASWNLDNDSVVTTSTAVPPVSLLLAATDLPTRTLSGYATAVGYSYTDGTTTFHDIANASVALQARYGVIQEPLDLTAAGALTGAQAASIAQAALARMSANGLPWTDGFTVLPGQLFTLNGTLITDLSTVDANVTVRIVDVAAGNGLAAANDIPIGQIDYDDTTGQLTLTPAAMALDSLAATIARARNLSLTSG